MALADSEWAMHMLFTAKWNIPQATIALGLSNKEQDWGLVKAQFIEYCRANPMTYNGTKPH